MHVKEQEKRNRQNTNSHIKFATTNYVQYLKTQVCNKKSIVNYFATEIVWKEGNNLGQSPGSAYS